MFKKNSLTLVALGAMVLFAAGCGGAPDQSGQTGGGGASIFDGASPTVSGDLCSAFPTDWVAGASGKEIVKTAKSTIQSVSDCEYFLTVGVGGSGKRIDLVHEHLDIEIQKKARDIAGSRWENGSGFAMDTVLMYNSKGDLTDVDILLGPMEYLRINSLQSALTSDELVAFGKKVAERIKSGKAHGSEAAADNSTDQSGGIEAQESAKDFFNKIGSGDVSGAVGMMDMNQATKDMWKQSFGAISSLTVKSMEPTFQSEWTSERETYKVTLDVKVKGENTYGWENGTNIRWIAMQKSGGTWMVHEISSNP